MFSNPTFNDGIPTRIGAFHYLVDRSRHLIGFEVYFDSRRSGWMWLPVSCFLSINLHGPFETAQLAWEAAVDPVPADQRTEA